ncbi:hypothetical protein OG978_34115 [Streptomyces sp. NBC_01591]|uniref:hypothetical protein n=1 Tax=Streptomyces sp. NBC_01591 TaxID=2975888 RepID=UPI002DDA285C|nr:hypothetical protein [Streptomyces sp. NBC_01591]WSD71994.1 hypothetical protein OG978_34115 [Streptomyces sp. NBC_01591]
MTGRHSGTRRAAWAAVVVLGLTGGSVLGGGAARADDGIDKLTAQQIADRSRDALLSVRSLHLSTRGNLGENSPRMTLELTLDRDGNCNGSVDLGHSQGSVRIVKRGDDVWVKPDANFWKNQVPGGGSAFAAILGGRYMKGSADDPRLRGLANGCDLDTFQKLVSDNANNDRGTLNKGHKTTLDGAPVVPLTRMRDGQTLTMYVAATGKPYPLRITAQGGGTDAVVGFSAFDKPVPTTTPPPDQTYDISALLGRTPAPV